MLLHVCEEGALGKDVAAHRALHADATGSRGGEGEIGYQAYIRRSPATVPIRAETRYTSVWSKAFRASPHSASASSPAPKSLCGLVARAKLSRLLAFDMSADLDRRVAAAAKDIAFATFSFKYG